MTLRCPIWVSFLGRYKKKLQQILQLSKHKKRAWEAGSGFEPLVEVLQTSALPLG